MPFARLPTCLQVRAYRQCWDTLTNSSKGSKPSAAVPITMLMVVLPVVVVVALLLLYLGSLASLLGVFMVVNEHKTLASGFRFVGAMMYK